MLPQAEIERMRAEHVPVEERGNQVCRTCAANEYQNLIWPCDAAKLLAALDLVQAELTKWEDSHE